MFGLRNGAHAEYVCVGEERLLAHMPDHMTFEEAAGVCDGFYQGLGHLSHAGVGQGDAARCLRRLGIVRHRGGPARGSTTSVPT